MKRLSVAAAAVRRPRVPSACVVHLLVSSVLLLAAPARPALATDWEAYRGWKVRAFDVTGIEPGTATQIERGLALATTGILLTEMQVFFPETVTEDASLLPSHHTFQLQLERMRCAFHD